MPVYKRKKKVDNYLRGEYLKIDQEREYGHSTMGQTQSKLKHARRKLAGGVKSGKRDYFVTDQARATLKAVTESKTGSELRRRMASGRYDGLDD